jgi:hypothetical protein
VSIGADEASKAFNGVNEFQGEKIVPFPFVVALDET